MIILKHILFYRIVFVTTHFEIHSSLFVFPEPPINSRKTKINQLHRTFEINRSKHLNSKIYSNTTISQNHSKTQFMRHSIIHHLENNLYKYLHHQSPFANHYIHTIHSTFHIPHTSIFFPIRFYHQNLLTRLAQNGSVIFNNIF